MKRFFASVLVLCIILTSTMVFPLSVSADDWTSGWTMIGNGKIENGVLQLQATSAGEVGAKKTSPYINEDGFDVEFTMEVEANTQYPLVQVMTGKRRLYTIFESNSFRFRESDGNGGFVLHYVNFNISNERHTYRFISDGDNMDIYIDGYYIDSSNAPLSEQTGVDPGIRISANVTSGGKKASTQVTDVNIREYKPEKHSVSDTQTGSNVDDKTIEVYESFRYDFEDGEDLSAWQIADTQGEIWVEDGYMKNISNNTSWVKANRFFNMSDEFVVEAKMVCKEFGDYAGLEVYWDGLKYTLKVYKDYFLLYNNALRARSDALDMTGDKGHVIRLESYNNKKNIRVYCDNVLVGEGTPTKTAGTMTDLVSFFTQTYEGVKQETWLDWIEFTNITCDAEMTMPFENATYLEGTDIPLCAKMKEDVEVPYLEYKINGKVVATGKAENQYQATLKGLTAGNYVVYAEYDNHRSTNLNFEVLPAVTTSGIQVQQTAGDTVTVQVGEIYGVSDSIAKVDYFVNGAKAASASEPPYIASITGLSAEGHEVRALYLDQNGVALHQETAEVMVLPEDGKTSVNYSNEISYQVSGENGNAIINHGNGVHQVYLKHTKDGITYLTSDGEETYNTFDGIGEYRIITDGPYADVYRYGQLAFSYYLPLSTEVVEAVQEKGLEVADFKVTMPERRKNFFVKRSVADKKVSYDLAGMDYYHNLDFVADQQDQARLILTDQYFRTEVYTENGRLYAVETEFSNTQPRVIELGDMPEGEAHYRISTAGGMSTVFINGRWIRSFRSVRCVGGGALGVDVESGELRYLSVNNYNDLSMYTDDFDGKGQFASTDYWIRDGMQIHTDYEKGEMNLLAHDVEDAIAELGAYVGNADLSVKVKIQNCEGGFWFILNHSVTEAYTKVGYNFKTKKFEMIDKAGVAEPLTEGPIYVDGIIHVGEWVQMDLKIRETPEGKQVTLYVDGQPVIHTKKSQGHRGKLGFMLSNGAVAVSEVSYRGDAKPILDMRDHYRDGYTPHLDLYEIDEPTETLVMTGVHGFTYSTDGGKTWTESKKTKEQLVNNNVLRMSNGTLLTMARVTGGTVNGSSTLGYQAAVSEDDGRTWTALGMVTDDFISGRGKVSNRLTEGYFSGRIYFTCQEGGGEHAGYAVVYYSDNYGKTWKKSAVVNSVETGTVGQENSVIELSKNHVRMFFRSNLGYLCYYDSYDGGVTFEKEAHSTPFLSTTTCYTISQDSFEPNILYAGWAHENDNLSGQDQTPRTRWSLAVSYDYGQTWEMIGTAHENNAPQTADAIMMNLSTHIAKDYILLEAISEDSLSGAPKYSRIITIPKNKQIGSKKLEATHHKYYTEIEIDSPVKERILNTIMRVYPAENKVYMDGLVTEDAAYDKMVQAECAASHVGAQITKGEDGTISLQIGDMSVVFSGKEVAKKDGKDYLDMKLFAERFGLCLYENRGVYIITSYQGLSNRQSGAIRNAVNLFAKDLSY